MGAVADVVGGGTPSTGDESNFVEHGIPWLTPADLTGYRGIYISRGRRDLSEGGYRASAARIMPTGTVLFSSRAPIGYCVIAAGEVSTNQGFKSFVLKDGLSPEFVRHYLLSSVGYAESKASGTTFKELSGSRAAELAVPVPPLPEQRRIVAKIDGLSNKSARARDYLDHIPRLVEKYKQAILAAAFRGDLTREWRVSRSFHEDAACLREELATLPNAKRASQIVAEQIESLDGSDLPESWAWMPVGVVATKVADGVHKKPVYVDRGVPFITVRNLTAGPGLSFKEAKFISPEDHREFVRRTHPEEGDILITKDGTLGVVRAIRAKKEFSIFVSVALVKPAIRLMTDYLELAFQTPIVQGQMVGVGTGLQHIHLTDLRRDLLPIAPAAEREEIVRRVRVAFAWIDRLAKEATSARKLVGHLDQAVLAKAFQGELVPQDPNDEPASVLLNRIRAERGAEAKSGRGRRSRTAQG